MVQNLENEIWKPIKGYEGLYEVSNMGRVKSLHFGKEKLLKLQKHKFGYDTLMLHQKEEKPKHFNVHRLVAEAFIPNPDNLPCVNHKDCNTSNSIASNLEWCTQQYNLKYNNAHLRAGKKTPVYQLNKDTNEIIKEWESIRQAAQHLGVCSIPIYNCCKNNKYRKTAYGYKWRYV